MIEKEKILLISSLVAIFFGLIVWGMIRSGKDGRDSESSGWIQPDHMRPSDGEKIVALYAIDSELVPERVVYQVYSLSDGGYAEHWIRYTDGSAQPDLGRPIVWNNIPVYPDLYLEAMSKKR